MQEIKKNYQEYPIRFYSKLVDWLEQSAMQTATGAQWAGTLRNLKGMRREELELALPIDELANELADVKLERSVLLEIALDRMAECYPSLLTQKSDSFNPGVEFRRIAPELVPSKVLQKYSFTNVLRCYQHTSLGYRVMEVAYHDLLSSAAYWLIFDDKWNLYRRNGGARADYGSSLSAIDEMYQIILDRFGDFQSPVSHNVYDQYSLKGGRNYSEWLLSLDKWLGLPYEYGHFDMDNVLLHLRTSEWVDVDGERLLLVDELQSDWNAHYRSLANQGDESELLVAAPPFGNDWHELGIKVACMIALKAGLKKIAFTTGELQCQRYRDSYKGLLNLYDRLIPKALERFGKPHGAKLGWSKIQIKEPNLRVTNRYLDGWGIEQSSKLLFKNIRHKKVAMAYVEAKSNSALEDVRVFEIPHSLLSEIASRGLPLFGW